MLANTYKESKVSLYLPTENNTGSDIHVQTISHADYCQAGLGIMRNLVYAVYTPDQKPVVIPQLDELTGKKPPLHRYVAAGLPSEGLVKNIPPNLLSFDEGKSLEPFNTIGGFFCIEIAQTPSEGIEAESYFNWSGWDQHQGERVAYLSEFSAHPRLSHHGKLEVLKSLFQTCRQELKRQYVNSTYIVLAPKVHSFVEEAAHATLTHLEASYRQETVDQMINLFPGYWNQSPQLYRIELHA